MYTEHLNPNTGCKQDDSHLRKLTRQGLLWSAVLISTLLQTPAFAQSFLGKWTATATTPGGETSETLTVTKVDSSYVITVEPPAGTPPQFVAGPGTDIVIDQNSFSYKRSLVMGPDSTLELVYSGEISGDTFTGKASMLGTEVPYNGVRIKEAAKP